jgi:hypothetical protein
MGLSKGRSPGQLHRTRPVCLKLVDRHGCGRHAVPSRLRRLPPPESGPPPARTGDTVARPRPGALAQVVGQLYELELDVAQLLAGRAAAAGRRAVCQA